MGLGKKYTLKMDKKDEINPGPKYATEKVHSFEMYVKHLQDKPYSTFGCDKKQSSKCVYTG